VRECLDEVWFLQAPSEELRVSRLIERHEHFGKTHEHAVTHVLETDERNANLVASQRERADLILRREAW
jgi:pantothenate kinase